MAHGDAREGKWRGNWRMEWVASTLHTISEHGVSSITTADAHTTAASSRMKWCQPTDLNGIVRFAERRNLVSARVPSHFKRSLPWALSCFPKNFAGHFGSVAIWSDTHRVFKAPTCPENKEITRNKNTCVSCKTRFAKLRKTTVGFVKSVRPFARNNSAPTGRIFMKFGIWIFFFSKNMWRKFKFHWTLKIIAGTLHEGLCALMIISR